VSEANRNARTGHRFVDRDLALWTFLAIKREFYSTIWWWSVDLFFDFNRAEYTVGAQDFAGRMTAINMGDQMALFNQYDSEYCTKATDVARKVQAVSSLGSG
jgi:hypothetical protein